MAGLKKFCYAGVLGFLCLGLKFFFDLLDVHVLYNWLEVLALQ